MPRGIKLAKEMKIVKFSRRLEAYFNAKGDKFCIKKKIDTFLRSKLLAFC